MSFDAVEFLNQEEAKVQARFDEDKAKGFASAEEEATREAHLLGFRLAVALLGRAADEAFEKEVEEQAAAMGGQ
jgi:hypothetical protein